MQELELADFYTRVNNVVELMLKGNSIPSIAKELGMKQVDVVECIDHWKSVAANTTQIQDRARDAIAGADQHYAMVIERLWETVEQADNGGELRTKSTTLKMVADVEQKRIDMLQKAGLLDNQELSAQMAATQKKQDALMQVLREVAGECEHCRGKILNRLAKISGQAEGVIIQDES